MIFFGLLPVVIGAARFVRAELLLEDQEAHLSGGSRAEVLLSAALALIVSGCSIYLVLGLIAHWAAHQLPICGNAIEPATSRAGRCSFR